MENTNEMKIIFDSRPENEGLARVAAAAFCTQLNPTLEEVADLKTAVSEAVTNCIIHAYEGQVQKIEIFCRREGQKLWVDVIDKGVGDQRRCKSYGASFYNKAGEGSFRDGICVYGSIYGSGRSGIHTGRRNRSENEKNNW